MSITGLLDIFKKKESKQGLKYAPTMTGATPFYSSFGDSVYDMQMSEYKEEYRVCDWKESVRRTEG